MKRNSKLILLAVLTYLLIACSNESGQDGSKKAVQKSTEINQAITTASESVSEMAAAAEKVATPVIEDAQTGVEEIAEVVKSAVKDTNPETMSTSSDTDAASSENASSEPQEHIVKGVITQWQPLVTFAQPGDVIRFTGMTGHDTASMEGMIPEGATVWRSKLGEEGFTVKVEKEGGYVYKCTPHITTGMVGIIVVGDKNPANLAQLEANAGNVKVGGNMVKRAIRKLKKQLEP